jgi:alpha-D-xyloside xylohydrolase
LFAAAAILGSAGLFPALSYTVTARDSVADGVVFTMSNNAKMKVQVCSDRIIRVVYTLQSTIPAAADYIVVKGTWDAAPWSAGESVAAYSLSTGSLNVDVAKESGAVSFSTASGSPILRETAGKTLTSKKVGTYTAYEGTISFNGDPAEGIYGFGQFQNGILNQRGQALDLVQLNQTDCSPFFMSTRGFGVLWNNYSEIKVSAPLTLWCNWATNDAIDYYFIYGPAFDSLIASYRQITGPATMWPKWAYGFWQCRNRYTSQNEIRTVVGQYRAKNYPIDNIVQDWQYYPDGMNGCQCFDATRFPDARGMIKTLHDSLNCHFTISVWPSFAPGSGANYTFMSSHGYLLTSNDYLGTTYDAFNDSAAFYYWKFINDSLVSKDVDGFWPDATEPEWHTTWITATTVQGPAPKVENLFPLLHSKTLYDGFRAANNEKKRVCNLTRSYYAGSQRLGAAYWTGDIETDFVTFTKQVPAGLNVCASGLPLFCTDVGGFTGDVTAEVLTRWFEWGAFNPVFRVHGTRDCNEIWCWGAQTEAILAKYLKLRYRLFPYVYSVAWKVASEGYTMMRALPFDFMDDPNVYDIANEFMFGPALLICPVTSSATATSRPVYLPAGTWYDFWTGAPTPGAAGRSVTAQSPLETIPMYVRAGSIVPLGPEITYADTAADPIELRVYTGESGSFNLYEDEGDGYAYEKGVYATIPIFWNETSQTLTIGDRRGSFPGMLENRTFNVVFVTTGRGTGGAVSATIDKTIPYEGRATALNRTTGEIIAVRQPRTVPASKGAAFHDRVRGNSYIVAVSGWDVWRIALWNASGRLVASKRIQGPGRAVADRLPSGIYLSRISHGTAVEKFRTVVVP